MSQLDPGRLDGIHIAEIAEDLGSKVLVTVIFLCIRVPVCNVISIWINVNICRSDKGFYFVFPFVGICIETLIADFLRLFRVAGNTHP